MSGVVCIIGNMLLTFLYIFIYVQFKCSDKYVLLPRLYLGLLALNRSTVSQFLFSCAFFNFFKKTLNSLNFQTTGSCRRNRISWTLTEFYNFFFWKFITTGNNLANFPKIESVVNIEHDYSGGGSGYKIGLNLKYIVKLPGHDAYNYDHFLKFRKGGSTPPGTISDPFFPSSQLIWTE